MSMHAVIGATEEHNLTNLLRCITLLELFLNETMLVVDIFKSVAVSRRDKILWFCVYRLQMAECD